MTHSQCNNEVVVSLNSTLKLNFLELQKLFIIYFTTINIKKQIIFQKYFNII